MGRLGSIVAAGSLALVVLAMLPTAAAAAPTLAQPVSIEVPGGPFLRVRVTPGRTWSGTLDVESSSPSRPVSVVLYPTDGLTAPSTGVSFSLRGQALRPVGAPHAEGSWLTLGRSHLSVPASGSVPVRLRVAVPIGASPGEHVAGIALQPVAAQKSRYGSLEVRTVSRVAVAVVVVVPGPASFRLAIGHPKFPALPSHRHRAPAMVVPLTDTGGDYSRMVLSATVTGPSGRRRRVSRRLGVILPGDTSHVSLPWPAPLTAAGAYTVALDATWPGGSSSSVYHIHLAGAQVHSRLLGGHGWASYRSLLVAASCLSVAMGLCILALRALRRRATSSATTGPGADR